MHILKLIILAKAAAVLAAQPSRDLNQNESYNMAISGGNGCELRQRLCEKLMDDPNAKFNLRFASSDEISSSLISISVQLPIWPAACGLCLPILRTSFTCRISFTNSAADRPHTSLPPFISYMYVYIEASIWASDYLTIREMQQSNADEKKKIKRHTAIVFWLPSKLCKWGILGCIKW